MSKATANPIVFIICTLLYVPFLLAQWEPPAQMTREEIVQTSKEILALPDIPITTREDLFRIRVLEMDWDLGAMVYEPRDSSRIPTDPVGNRIGVFLIHGGSGDFRSMDQVARLLAGKFGFKAVSLSFPGRLYLLDPSRNWPGDTIKPDGSVRTPIWNKDKLITRDQYEVVKDDSLKKKYGTLTLACAKEGTEFYNRMAGWPVAFEQMGKDLMARHFPVGEYSIYIHGHSTGGPFAFIFTQRVANIVGVLGMETSSFGYIVRAQARASGNPTGKQYGDLPFNCLHVRTWGDIARYVGPETFALKGRDSLIQLPSLMEEVFEKWDRVKHLAQIKAEGPVHYGSLHQLANQAKATARRLNLSTEETQELMERYVGYSRELWGLDVKPVPPVLFGVAEAGHDAERYMEVTLPMYAGMDPPPKVRLVQYRTGIHGCTTPEPELPMGPFPAVAKVWHEAIAEGYYADYARQWATSNR